MHSGWIALAIASGRPGRGGYRREGSQGEQTGRLALPARNSARGSRDRAIEMLAAVLERVRTSGEH